MNKINQYSLTETTTLLEKHYSLQHEKIKYSKEVLNYNNHKIRHTYAVLFVTQKLLTYEKEIFFDNEVVKKVQVASLLHDIWRFYQNDLIKVLSNDEFEHWDFWYELLIKEGITDLSILFAVKYHNKKNIDWLFLESDYLNSDENKKEEIINIVNITRDADKIQNLEYVIFNFNDVLYWKYDLNDSYDENNLNDFLDWRIADNNNVKTYIDYLLLLSGWVNDLNFKTSNKFLKHDWFLEFIISQLSKTTLDKKIISKIKNKLDELIEGK